MAMQEERDARQRADLGQRHGVLDRPGDGVADRVDARAIVAEEHAIRLIAARKTVQNAWRSARKTR